MLILLKMSLFPLLHLDLLLDDLFLSFFLLFAVQIDITIMSTFNHSYSET